MKTWFPSEAISGLAQHVNALIAAVVDGPAHTAARLRQSICEGAPSDLRLVDYVEKVRNRSYRIAPSDIDVLRAAGFSDDAIFEITVAAALGAGLHRLRCGLRALGVDG